MSPQVEAVTSRLRQTWLRWRTFSLWTAVVLAAGVSLGILALFILADALFRLPQSMLAALFLAWAGVSLAAFSFPDRPLEEGKTDPGGHRAAGGAGVSRAGKPPDQHRAIC